MTDPNRMVTLRNGEEAPASAVVSIHLTLTHMMTEGGIRGVLQAYDLREWCKGRLHDAAKQAQFVSMGFGGGSDGGAHDVVKAVIESSLVGEGLSMHLQSPVQGDSHL